MARDLLRVWQKLERIHCYDEGDGWGSAEPYLWTVFFKIDGETVSLTESLTLVGSATVVPTPGSHGNLGDTDVDAGDDVGIPGAIGECDLFLKPIPVPASLKPIMDDLPGVIGVVCVLMEEDNVTDDGAEAGHAALNGAVTSALNDIIQTRSFSNQNITAEEIDQYMGSVRQAVTDAIQNQQNFFENLWSWLNKDDTIGTKVFFWTHDDLSAGDVLDFSQRWPNEGDWELYGHVNASVACPANAMASASEVINAIFAAPARDMRAFRDREIGGTQLQRWWDLAERSAPQLVYALRRDPQLSGEAAALLRAVPELLGNRGARLSDEHIEHARRILRGLERAGSRRGRLDASRALAVLGHLQGKTVREAIELLSSVPPGRTPRPIKSVEHLISPSLRVLRSLLEPIAHEAPGRTSAEPGPRGGGSRRVRS